jgi:ATP-dependent HslUV protease subunit HslV
MWPSGATGAGAAFGSPTGNRTGTVPNVSRPLKVLCNDMLATIGRWRTVSGSIRAARALSVALRAPAAVVAREQASSVSVKRTSLPGGSTLLRNTSAQSLLASSALNVSSTREERLARHFGSGRVQRAVTLAAACAPRPRAVLPSAGSNQNFCTALRKLGTACLYQQPQPWHHTTILAVRKSGQVCLVGDGQVSMGETILKANARKVRRLGDSVIAGFSGATADALTLFERLEQKLEAYPDQLLRASVELAKEWRQDKALRRLDALLLVADRSITLTLTGTGDVLEPSDGVMAIGSGGMYALAAARALLELEDWTAERIARRAMQIASEICVFTNEQLTCEVLSGA